MIPLPTLLAAYRIGFFPMGDARGGVDWYSPDPRGIIPFDRFHVPRRLARTIRQGRFDITIDRAFADVMVGCAARRNDGVWITQEILDSYQAAHRAGYAHSVEAWRRGRLVGGVYGISLRGAFFGESMFHRATDASKVALCALVDRLRGRSYRLLDVQWVTPHLAQFGATEIPREDYLRLLEESMKVQCSFV